MRALLMILLLAAGPARAETVLKVAIQGDLRILDPVWSNVVITQMFAQMTYDRPYALDGDLRPRPEMVETADIAPDGLTYRFILRPELLLHDGTPCERTPADQAEIVQALQDRFQQVMPYIPVGQFTRPMAHRDAVHGFLRAQMLVFWNATKEPTP